MKRLILLLAVALLAAVLFLGDKLGLMPPSTQNQQARNTTNAPFHLIESDIASLQAALKSGQTSCQAVVQTYLDRIAQYDKPSGLNAITVLNPKALEKAISLDRRLKSGDRLGKLFCVPMLVKDNFDTHDMITSGGSIALKGSMPPDDAFMVRRLREEDAIIIAKTNMAEWAFSPRESISSSFGQTANAYDLSRTPAGSSGGTASGVAANFAIAGLGSDTGNSIRGPSSHAALVGIRSTIGLTSRDGVIPLSFDRDIAGPMARSVADSARLLSVLAGYDPKDPYTAPMKGKDVPNYTDYLNINGLEGKRIGILKALVDTADADVKITDAFFQAVEVLSENGAEIIDPIDIDNWETHMQGENYFCRRFRYDMAEYLKTLGPNAPIKDVKEALDKGQYHPSAKGGLEYFSTMPADVHPKDWEKPCPDYADHPGRQQFLKDVVAAMELHDLDALIYPTWNNPPAPLDDAVKQYKGDNSQRVAPATGMPAITVPMGWYDDKWPMGLQILARPFEESVLYELAYAYEQHSQNRRPPPLFP